MAVVPEAVARPAVAVLRAMPPATLRPTRTFRVSVAERPGFRARHLTLASTPLVQPLAAPADARNAAKATITVLFI